MIALDFHHVFLFACVRSPFLIFRITTFCGRVVKKNSSPHLPDLFVLNMCLVYLLPLIIPRFSLGFPLKQQKTVMKVEMTYPPWNEQRVENVETPGNGWLEWPDEVSLLGRLGLFSRAFAASFRECTLPTCWNHRREEPTTGSTFGTLPKTDGITPVKDFPVPLWWFCAYNWYRYCTFWWFCVAQNSRSTHFSPPKFSTKKSINALVHRGRQDFVAQQDPT